MKYVILVYDGAADYKIKELGDKTPFEVASKPMLDKLARTSTVGLVSNVPSDMVPESDTANLAIMSYDPKIYSNGRSPPRPQNLQEMVPAAAVSGTACSGRE